MRRPGDKRIDRAIACAARLEVSGEVLTYLCSVVLSLATLSRRVKCYPTAVGRIREPVQ